MQRRIRAWMLVLAALAAVGARHADAEPQPPAAPLEQALLLSDIHFDPLHDPARAERLFTAPESAWQSILAEPAGPDAAAAFAKLQKSCGAKGVDTPEALLDSSLAALREHAPSARFALVSGDLVVHKLDCRFKTLLPGKSDAEYAAFVAKTVRYVALRLHAALPGVPVYLALGNNDSGCGDYELDTDDPFLAATRAAVLDDLAPPAEHAAALASYAHAGDYSVRMQGGMRKTRLLVLDDLLQSKKYTGCGNRPASQAAAAQIAWLRTQLAAARQAGEHVWVMGHIPAGVDPYSTAARLRNVCAGDQPEMFLSSDALANLMSEYADVITLGIFGHTHMDEMRLFGAEGVPAASRIAIKMVASISPVDGNNPSFLVARVDPVAARLVDYTVFAASNQTGRGTTWSPEYSYAESFHEAAFTPAALGDLLGAFGKDTAAQDASSQAYLQHYFVGVDGRALSALWPQYVCAMGNYTRQGYAACVCGR
ncbi:MAG: metallophosphoesterase [Acidobacteriota bacterium]|nr:metallophosphoesterase [Acidobacteriota bacterium]